ncbi:TonB-dependent siderophore receptor [Pseudomonas sp. LRF_L74]|uniref:TonB-dependent siderophore receptor n=1 Tax=Pseudomonas sp. LRF_L74 TaxID=3369422 RepID=UPI003F5EE758
MILINIQSMFVRKLFSNYALKIRLPVVSLALSIPVTAQAQEFYFDLPSQPLKNAIQSYSKQAEMQVLYGLEDLDGKYSSPIHGRYSPEHAILLLLSNTGVEFSIVDGSILLRSSGSSGSAVNLGETSVTGRSTEDSSITEGTGSYTQTGSSSTATGLDLTLRETPQSITVVTRKKMDDFNQQTLKDVLEATPGVFVDKQGDLVTFFARGAAINNFQTDGSRSATGTRSNGAIISHNLISDDMADIDRIEILKGSAGLLQGDGYPTATVNMIRKKPTKIFQANVGASAGTWDAYRADIDVSGPITEDGNVRGRAVLAYKDANSYRDSVKNRNSMFYGTFDFDLSSDTTINLGLDYKERSNRGNSGYNSSRAYDTAGNFQGWTARSRNAAAPWSGYDQNSISIFSSLEHNFSNRWKAKLLLSAERNETPDWINASIYLPGAAELSRYKDMKDDTKNIKIDVKGDFDFLGRTHDLLFGVDYIRNNYKMDQWRGPANYRSTTLIDYQNITSDPEVYANDGGRYYPKPEGEWDIRYLFRNNSIRRGAYLTTRFNLYDGINLIVGGRVSDYFYKNTERNVYLGSNDLLTDESITETGVITPYTGLVYDINNIYSLYASYASVFQPVLVQDEQGSTLKPQEGVTYELGSKAEFFDGRLNASFAYFWKRWENTYELSGGLTPTGGEAYRNISGVMEHGYELEVSGELAPRLQAQGSYVMNNSETSKTNPKHQFKINANYDLSGSFEKLSLGAGVRWQSKINTYTYANLEQSSYWIADAMARYKISQKMTVGVNINNLFDKKYFAGVATMTGWGEYYTWGEPRNLTASFRYTY